MQNLQIMRNRILYIFFTLILGATLESCQDLPAQTQQEPWKEEQLMEPSELAEMLKSEEGDLPVIISLGAGNIIGNSKDTGPSGEKESLQNLKNEIEDLSRDTDIVLYCGCCPFVHCPNIRPAFSLLNELGFENHKLLNLRDNIKVDWIDKGYPVSN